MPDRKGHDERGKGHPFESFGSKQHEFRFPYPERPAKIIRKKGRVPIAGTAPILPVLYHTFIINATHKNASNRANVRQKSRHRQ